MQTTILMMLAIMAPADIELPIDNNTSRIEVELCVQNECDTDSSAVSGIIVIEPDCILNPTEVALEDFDIQADSTLSFHLDYGFIGDIFADAENLRLFHANPFNQPFEPIIEGSFSPKNVPFLQRGMISYEAKGIICGIIEGLGVPCEASLDLEENPASIIEEFQIGIEFVNDEVRISGRLDFDEPFDPEQPDLGLIRGFAIINAAAPLPQGPDLDGDHDVDLADVQLIQLCFGGADQPPSDSCPQNVNADLDGDEDVDPDDYTVFSRCVAAE